MDVFSFIAEIFRDLLIFVGAMTALLIGLIVVISRLSPNNPLKRVLTALCYRVGATAAAGLVAIPTEPVPGLDGIYDIAVPLVLIWYWITFFRDVLRSAAPRSQRGNVEILPPLPTHARRPVRQF
jgi:hypothetical protein